MEKKALSIKLYCEKRQLPVSVEHHPRLSWIIDGCPGDFRQQTYRIRVASEENLLDKPDVWDSGEAAFEHNGDVELPSALRSNTRYWWQLAVRGEAGQVIASEPAWFETGLLAAEDWQAEWIGAGEGYVINHGLQFRKAFRLEKPVRKAKIFVSGLGCYELALNGRRVGDAVLDPAHGTARTFGSRPAGLSEGTSDSYRSGERDLFCLLHARTESLL